jgi:hypothetical protein
VVQMNFKFSGPWPAILPYGRELCKYVGGDLSMPAARPSQASVSNAINAILNAGLLPAQVNVSPDGAFSIGIAPVQCDEVKHAAIAADKADAPLKWGDYGED